MIKTITNVAYLPEVALITINNIPNSVDAVADILGKISDMKISVDMICQTAPYKEKINLSFTIHQDDLQDIIAALPRLRQTEPSISIDVNGNNTKLILTGEGMRSTYGVAAEVFAALKEAKIGVKLITTAETEISCLIDIKDVEKAKQLFKN